MSWASFGLKLDMFIDKIPPGLVLAMFINSYVVSEFGKEWFTGAKKNN